MQGTKKKHRKEGTAYAWSIRVVFSSCFFFFLDVVRPSSFAPTACVRRARPLEISWQRAHAFLLGGWCKWMGVAILAFRSGFLFRPSCFFWVAHTLKQTEKSPTPLLSRSLIISRRVLCVVLCVPLQTPQFPLAAPRTPHCRSHLTHARCSSSSFVLRPGRRRVRLQEKKRLKRGQAAAPAADQSSSFLRPPCSLSACACPPPSPAHPPPRRLLSLRLGAFTCTATSRWCRAAPGSCTRTCAMVWGVWCGGVLREDGRSGACHSVAREREREKRRIRLSLAAHACISLYTGSTAPFSSASLSTQSTTAQPCPAQRCPALR